MKGGFGRKKSESTNQQQQEETPPPSPPFDEEEKDVYDGEEEEEVEEENNQAEEEEVEERPKLAEGFFEIEDVRRKRIRKGKVQYLIKWRGWPETANTWEPVDNLQSCSDIIAAFEHRSSKTSKKRKRKQSITQTQPKKRQPRTNSTSIATQPSDNSLCQSNAAPPQGVEEGKAGESTSHVETEVDHGHQGVEKISTVEHLAEDGPTSISVDKNRNKEADGVVDGEFSVQVPDTRSIGKDGVEEQSKAETLLANGFTGAKKRKSGRVRRFKQAALNELDDARHPVTRTTNGPTQAPETLRDDALNEDNLETSVNPSSIVKIIKPMGFSTSVSNNVHDVSLTFRIRRSNGQEEVVDNNYLKVNNPLLLINFYEQHLRYSPPA